MNFYLNALQDEHIILEQAINGYIEQIKKVAPVINNLLKEGKADKIILAGMGSSLYAAKSIIGKLNNSGIFTIAANAFETLYFQSGLVDKRSIVILISQSGNTKEIVELSDLIKDKAALTISMLNADESLMKGKSDYELYIKMGQETPISNKSYYGQVAMLNVLAAALIGEDLDVVASEIRKATKWADDFVKNQDVRTNEIIEFIADSRHIDLLGDDASIGAALQTGLVWRECIKMPVFSYSTSDYSHGWFWTAKKDNLLVFYTDKLNWLEKNVYDYAMENGAKILLISTDEEFEKNENLMQIRLPEVEHSLLPLYSIVPSYFVAGFKME